LVFLYSKFFLYYFCKIVWACQYKNSNNFSDKKIEYSYRKNIFSDKKNISDKKIFLVTIKVFLVPEKIFAVINDYKNCFAVLWNKWNIFESQQSKETNVCFEFAGLKIWNQIYETTEIKFMKQLKYFL